MKNNILVIEDESTISSKIVDGLSKLIDLNNIKLATNIKDSLSLLDAFKFNIIILDLHLSDGNGITVLNKVKKDNPDTLVYVFSINSELEKICLNKGASLFFDKSKDFDHLISAVNTACPK